MNPIFPQRSPLNVVGGCIYNIEIKVFIVTRDGEGDIYSPQMIECMKKRLRFICVSMFLGNLMKHIHGLTINTKASLFLQR